MKVKIFIGLFLFLINISFAENTKILTLEGSVKIALSKSKKLKIAELNYKKAKLSYESTRISQHFPELDISGTAPSYNQSSYLETMYNSELGIWEDVRVNRTTTRYNGSLSLSQKIFTGGKFSVSYDVSQYQSSYSGSREDFRNATVNAAISFNQSLFQFNQYKSTWHSANQNFEQSKINYQNSIRNIEKEITRQFVNALTAQKKLVLQRKSFEIHQERFLMDKKKYEEGLLSELDFLRSEIDLNNAEIILNQQINDYQNQLEGLKNVLQISSEDSFYLEEPEIQVTVIDWDYYEDFSIESAPQILSKERSLEQLEESLAKAHDKNNFTVDFSGSYGFEGEGKDINGAWENFDPQNKSVNMRLSVNMPLWDGGVISREIEMAKTDYKIAELELEEERESAILDLKEKLQKIRRLELDLVIQRKTQILSERELEISLSQYQNGLLNFEDYVETQENYLNSVVKMWQTFLDYKTTLWELEELLGVQLTINNL